MAVIISGMFGDGNTYFAGSPAVIRISGLEWPHDPDTQKPTSAISVVRLQVIHESNVVGDFRADAGNKPDISFDISSALRAIWSSYDYSGEVEAAETALGVQTADAFMETKEYSLTVYTEYVSPVDGEITTTQCEDEYGNKIIPGGRCLPGGMTEMERFAAESADVSALEHTGVRNGDASTKPTESPELVGSDSITSWVDVSASGIRSVFYPPGYNGGAGESDDIIFTDDESPAEEEEDASEETAWGGHAPIVERDTVPYVDFIFVNRRGAVETCSARTLESLGINVKTTQYARTGEPSFTPKRSIMAVATGGRRSWPMSSGHQTREWAEWWVLEFLMADQWWMRYRMPDGTDRFLPVTVTPAKEITVIYDRTKQNMPTVEFTVTMALEG